MRVTVRVGALVGVIPALLCEKQGPGTGVKERMLGTDEKGENGGISPLFPVMREEEKTPVIAQGRETLMTEYPGITSE